MEQPLDVAVFTTCLGTHRWRTPRQKPRAARATRGRLMRPSVNPPMACFGVYRGNSAGLPFVAATAVPEDDCCTPPEGWRALRVGRATGTSQSQRRLTHGMCVGKYRRRSRESSPPPAPSLDVPALRTATLGPVRHTAALLRSLHPGLTTKRLRRGAYRSVRAPALAARCDGHPRSESGLFDVERALGEPSDARQALVGGLGPDERLAPGVVCGDELVNGRFQGTAVSKK